MNHFRCDRCDHVFSEEDADFRESVETSDAWGHTHTEIDRWTRCPECQNESLVDYQQCLECSDAESIDGYDMCIDCLRTVDLPEYLEYIACVRENPLRVVPEAEEQEQTA